MGMPSPGWDALVRETSVAARRRKRRRLQRRMLWLLTLVTSAALVVIALFIVDIAKVPTKVRPAALSATRVLGEFQQVEARAVGIEVFIRVAYPADFPPGSFLGPFIGLCQQRHGTQNEILTLTDTSELRALLDYANRFHHDTNAAWETAAINDQELVDFARRTLAFAQR